MSDKVISKMFETLGKEKVEYADIRLENSLMTVIKTVNGKVEESTTGIESGIGLRILKEGVWGFSYGPIESGSDIVKMALQANRLNLRQKKQEVKLAEVKVIQDKFEGEQK
ncbi:MAG: hypothetical protein KAS47_09780, partial [Candidatus Heimdallarchaeota archaeon]|nr:hypothetical protein [Candidatus Heimdallarchaeota archaeon]